MPGAIPGKSIAPWTNPQVARLNEFQRCAWVHPFTCGGRQHTGGSPPLIATTMGWICADKHCGYRQTWAWEFMLRGAPEDPRTMLTVVR